jgi:hypothetical protein
MSEIAELVIGRLNGHLLNGIAALAFIFAVYAAALFLRGRLLLAKNKKGQWRLYNSAYEERQAQSKSLAALADLAKRIGTVEDKINGVSLDTLKLAVYCETMPLAERCCSGVRYLALGGNSETAAYIQNTLKKENSEVYAMAEKLFAKQAF